MKATILGSGSPIPDPRRGGTGIALDIGSDTVLIDCGHGVLDEMIEARIHPATIEDLFFTHQHMDHNAGFFYFAIGSWRAGRTELTLYGPDGTEALTESLENIYAEDIEYRKSLGGNLEGIDDIAYRQVDEEFEQQRDGWSVSAYPVDHAIETYAYRFDEDTGASFVFSGDTSKLPGLADFAEGADILVHDTPFGPNDELPTDQLVWNHAISNLEEYKEKFRKYHATPREAGEIAQAAGVDTLVLTHFTAYRDANAMCEEARETFDGTVIPAENGLTLSAPF